MNDHARSVFALALLVGREAGGQGLGDGNELVSWIPSRIWDGLRGEGLVERVKQPSFAGGLCPLLKATDEGRAWLRAAVR